MLVADRVSLVYRGASRPAVADASVTVTPGRILSIVGPNGGGKTSLLRMLLGAVVPTAGTVTLEGRPIGAWPARERARRIGAMAQREDYPFAWKVGELVSFGRYPRLSAFAPLGPADRAAVAGALERADAAHLAERRIDTLSGGEWQRVRIARALAQEPDILILDEPTASLDFGHEMEIFELLRSLTDGGLATAVVTHHLNQAARFGDHLVLLHEGRLVAQGSPAEVLDADRLEEVFRWPVSVTLSDGVPQVSPRRRPLPPGTGSG